MGTVGYLLDTCTLLWAVRGSAQLSIAAMNALNDSKFKKYVSAVSAYEILYKHKIGKLPEFEDVAEKFFEYIQEMGVVTLSLDIHHAHYAGKLDWAHRDPFDRLLATQASVENLTLVTNDPAFESLSLVKTLW